MNHGVRGQQQQLQLTGLVLVMERGGDDTEWKERTD